MVDRSRLGDGWATVGRRLAYHAYATRKTLYPGIDVSRVCIKCAL